LETQKRIADLEDRLAAVQMSVALSAGAGGLMAGLSDDELRRLTPEQLENLSDRQLHAIAIRLRAAEERSGAAFDRPMFTLEELKTMPPEELERLRRGSDAQSP